MKVDVFLPTDASIDDCDLKDILPRLRASLERSMVFFDECVTCFVIGSGEKSELHSVFVDVSIQPSASGDKQGSRYGIDNKTNGQSANGSTSAFRSSTPALKSPAFVSPTASPKKLDHFINTSDPNGIDSYSMFAKTLDDSYIYCEGVLPEGDPYIIWKFDLPIVYPRRRYESPRIHFLCYVNEKTGELDRSLPQLEQEKDLEPYKFAERPNILENLGQNIRFEVDFNSTHPTRLDDAQPTTVGLLLAPKISRNGSRRSSNASLLTKHHGRSCLVSFPIFVSLVIRLKSTKPAGRNNVLLLTLNIESSEDLSLYEMHFSIAQLSVLFLGGQIENMNPESLAFPITFSQKESLNLAYKLITKDALEMDLQQEDYSPTKPVNIKLLLRVVLASGIFLSGLITTTWSPLLEFSVIAPPINSSLKKATSSIITALNQDGINLNSGRGSSLNLLSTPANMHRSALLNTIKQKANSYGDLTQMQNPILPYVSSALQSLLGQAQPRITNASASSVTVNLTNSASSALSGLRLTFTGKLSLELGQVTTWIVQAINMSTSVLNVSLLIQTSGSLDLSLSGSASNLLEEANTLLKPMVYSKKELNALYDRNKPRNTGVFVLNNDLRFGPLEPNCVFETRLQLIGVHRGMYHLDGIKIFDVVSGEGLDFGKLVEVFVV